MNTDATDSGAAIHLRITGRVQGVYYRASTVEQADRLGLSGWVANCADGSVEVHAEGPRSKLEELIAWCRAGPPGARVSRVEVGWRNPENRFRGFAIRR